MAGRRDGPAKGAGLAPWVCWYVAYNYTMLSHVSVCHRWVDNDRLFIIWRCFKSCYRRMPLSSARARRCALVRATFLLLFVLYYYYLLFMILLVILLNTTMIYYHLLLYYYLYSYYCHPLKLPGRSTLQRFRTTSIVSVWNKWAQYYIRATLYIGPFQNLEAQQTWLDSS